MLSVWPPAPCTAAPPPGQVNSHRTCSVNSTYVVQLVDTYEDDNNAYLVQEMCRGGDLTGVLQVSCLGGRSSVLGSQADHLGRSTDEARMHMGHLQ